jgi:hypothetical protein
VCVCHWLESSQYVLPAPMVMCKHKTQHMRYGAISMCGHDFFQISSDSIPYTLIPPTTHSLSLLQENILTRQHNGAVCSPFNGHKFYKLTDQIRMIDISWFSSLNISIPLIFHGIWWPIHKQRAVQSMALCCSTYMNWSFDEPRVHQDGRRAVWISKVVRLIYTVNLFLSGTLKETLVEINTPLL